MGTQRRCPELHSNTFLKESFLPAKNTFQKKPDENLFPFSTMFSKIPKARITRHDVNSITLLDKLLRGITRHEAELKKEVAQTQLKSSIEWLGETRETLATIDETDESILSESFDAEEFFQNDVGNVLNDF